MHDSKLLLVLQDLLGSTRNQLNAIAIQLEYFCVTLSLTNSQICLALCQNKFALLVHDVYYFVNDARPSAGELIVLHP